jgi:hypothetical protein
LQLKYQDWNKELLQKLKDTFDKGDIKQFYATAERVLRIKHGNPVVKSVIDDDGEMVTTKEEVSKKVAAYFEKVYQADRMTDVTHAVDDIWNAE